MCAINHPCSISTNCWCACVVAWMLHYRFDFNLTKKYCNIQQIYSTLEVKDSQRAKRGQLEDRKGEWKVSTVLHHATIKEELATSGLHLPPFRHGPGWTLWSWAGKRFSTMLTDVARGPTAPCSITRRQEASLKSVRDAVKCVPQINTPTTSNKKWNCNFGIWKESSSLSSSTFHVTMQQKVYY